MIARIYYLKILIILLVILIKTLRVELYTLNLALVAAVALMILALYEAASGLASAGEALVVVLLLAALLAQSYVVVLAPLFSVITVVAVVLAYARSSLPAYPIPSAIGLLASLYTYIGTIYFAVQTPAEAIIALSNSRKMTRIYALLLVTALPSGIAEMLTSLVGGIAMLVISNIGRVEKTGFTVLAPTVYTILKILVFTWLAGVER